MSLSAELKRLSNMAFQLEEENEQLRAEVERLSQPKPDRRDDLIRLMAPDIVQAGQTRNRAKYIYDCYDILCELYPAGMPKDENGEG